MDLRRTLSLFAAFLLLSAGAGCHHKRAAPAAATVGQPNLLETGFCADSCPKPCGRDDDCRTGRGELCCDFGEDGKACLDAKMCPRLCQSDDRCDSGKGEACERVTLESPGKVCAKASERVHVCEADNDCLGPGQVCCMAYNEPVCLPSAQCPKSCDTTADCAPAPGQVCCTTLADADTTLKPGGLCVPSNSGACPVACTQSADCGGNLLCCDGFCRTSCPRECHENGDCNAQLCCKTRATQSPLLGLTKRPGYSFTPLCTPGTLSTPGSLNDPCKQDQQCAQVGLVAVASCQPDGTFGNQCSCMSPLAVGPGMGIPGGCFGFVCNDGICRSGAGRCNGITECPGGEDESGCTTVCDGFQCFGGPCLALNARCDGFSQCPSGEDESGCMVSTGCSGFSCPGGPCLDLAARCNGFPQCAKGEDELSCFFCSGFLCSGGTCLSAGRRCDGAVDCPAGDDEQSCGDGG